MNRRGKTIIRYLIGITAIIVAILLTGFYYIFLYAVADAPPPHIVLVLLGILIGPPLFATGIVILLKRYQLAIYCGAFTGILYVIIPLFFDPYFFYEIVVSLTLWIFHVPVPVIVGNLIPAAIIFASILIAVTIGDAR